jgi:protoheme IX farnesyltransferase
MSETLKLIMTLSKLRIGFAIMLCALAGIAVMPGPGPGPGASAVLALAVLLSSGCAGAFNHYVERDLDRRMQRTRRRPFASGRLAPGWYWPALFAGLLVVAVLAAAAATNAVAAAHVFLGAFTYGVVYTLWLKRRTVWNIVLGGLAGSFAVLAGAAAVDPSTGPAALALALVLFFWTPPHFWSLAFVYKDEYAHAGVPMLPTVAGEGVAARVVLAHTVALVACSVVPAFYGMGWIYLAGALVGGAWFLRTSVRFARKPSRDTARLNFRASLAQLSLLLLGAMLDAAVMAALA